MTVTGSFGLGEGREGRIESEEGAGVCWRLLGSASVCVCARDCVWCVCGRVHFVARVLSLAVITFFPKQRSDKRKI